MLFGRDLELSTLASFADRVRGGRGGLLVVSGLPGIGKTALADHAAAASGLTVARGAAWDTGGAPALWPWSQILRAVGRTLPETAPDVDRFAQLEAIAAALVDAAARAPLLVVLDDLHAADPASLAALRVVVDDARTRPLGVIATRRDVGLDGDRADLLVRLDRLGEVIALRGVDASAAQAIVAPRLARPLDPAEAAALVDRTGGNPFLMQEIAVSGGATRGVRDAVLAHLGHLRADEVGLLGVAAVIGRDFDAALLAAAAGVEATAVQAVLERAGFERILVRVDREVRFSHALLRDTLYDALAPATRCAHHAQIADVLVARDARSAEIGRHLRLAGGARATDARTWTRTSIDAATRSRSPDELADAWEAWAELGELSADDRLAAGEAMMHAGRRLRATHFLAAALDHARGCGDVELESRAVVGLSGTLEFIHRDAEQVARIDDALARGPSRRWQIELLAQRARHAALGAADAPLRRTAAERALALAEDSGEPRSILLALDARLHAAYGADSLADRAEGGVRMLALATSAGLVRSRLDAMRWSLGARSELGHLESADADLDEYLRQAEALRVPGAMINARMRLAALAWHRGQWADGDAHAARAYALGRQTDDPQAELAWVAPRMMIASWRGDQATILAGVPVMLAAHRRLFAPFLPAVAAAALSAIGHRDEAWALVADLLVAPAAIPDDFARLAALACLAEVVADAAPTGARYTAAAALFELLTPYATRNVAMGGFGSLGSVAHRLGRLAAALGRRADAELALRAAVADHERWDARPMLAASLTELIAVVAVAEREALRGRARQLADQLGLVPLQGRLVRVGPELPTTIAARRAWLAPAAGGWQVGFDHPRAMADRRGLAYVARLVADPGVELDVLALAGADHTVEQTALEATDARAVAAYTQRLEALRAELDDAERRGAGAGGDAARAEIEALEDELVASRGLGGRTRTRGGSAERARSAVTVAIRRALDAVAEVDGALADHLRRAIRTGHRCAYVPDPNLALAWELAVTS